MKVHYINILLFAFPLNILVHNQRNHKKSILRTTKSKPIKAHRTLCECELYAPYNYENDPEMIEVMQDFNRQTSQRLREYEKRMIKNRHKSKEQCEKDIQKIILKDKIGKQIAEQFSSLETIIDTNDIPTCICEKSLADKTEKFCQKCGYWLGGVVPGLGVLGGYGAYELVELAKVVAIDSANKLAIEAGIEAGIAKVVAGIKSRFYASTVMCEAFESILNSGNYTDKTLIGGTFKAEYITKCTGLNADENSSALCLFKNRGDEWALKAIEQNAEIIAKQAGEETTRVTAEVTPKYIADGIAEATNASAILSNPIVISFIVIVTIIIILLIIYLILRYLRKKKMKKKLQYIKLLKE
ncbi:surface antigen [Plasmodium falciparum UGT5.1]|uniref:Surface antigen n=1 Tax=Plasmodium falciparum UGT5.1 TaxID=1237627 RepID=W7JCH4_PLAFA|nr:surface antigen [Plasmodium falciparum UGT5.1]